MKLFRRLTRALWLFLHVLTGILMILFLLPRKPQDMTEKHWSVIKNWMKGTCRVLGIYITVHGEPSKNTTLYVSNHISWHDILVLASLTNASFVAKQEIRHWPILGWMAYHGGALFIKRGKRDAFHFTRDALIKRLLSKQSIVLFPEGTTSDGKGVLKFRSRLYETAIDTETPIQAIAIRYNNSNGVNLTFVGNESMVGNTWRTTGEKAYYVDVTFCEPQTVTENTRHELAELTRQQIEKIVTTPHKLTQAKPKAA